MLLKEESRCKDRRISLRRRPLLKATADAKAEADAEAEAERSRSEAELKLAKPTRPEAASSTIAWFTRRAIVAVNKAAYYRGGAESRQAR
jgi:hypothetical protein